MVLFHLIILIAGFLIMALYFIAMLYLSVRLQSNCKSLDEKGKSVVSVIVAFRNEEGNLPALISSLAAQTYHQIQCILVDDNSTDRSFSMAISLCENDSRFQVLSQVEGRAGKKAAIELGLRHAVGNKIVFTDADCYFSSHWIKSLVAAMEQDKLDFCSAPVFIANPKTVIEQLQAVETAQLTGIGQALIASGEPVLCNGANMAISPSLFHAPMKNKVASGDDIFRMQYAVKTRKKIGYTTNRESHVFTPAEKTLRGWMNQRIRWAGKSKYYTDPFSLGFTLFVGLVQLTAVLSIFLFQPTVWAFLWGVKVLAEVIFITKVMRVYDRKFSFFTILLLGLVYPFFSVGVAVAALFVRPKWKGRLI
jgi:cellulose synthase/poly-beta-1,6-N-acetylglucosamine synthase-like glycosyltransferase